VIPSGLFVEVVLVCRRFDYFCFGISTARTTHYGSDSVSHGYAYGDTRAGSISAPMMTPITMLIPISSFILSESNFFLVLLRASSNDLVAQRSSPTLALPSGRG
jgi:hypothetical protein